MLCCLHSKTKNKKKIVFKVASPSAWAATLGKRISSPSALAAALGEEGVFPECLGCGSRGRGRLPRVHGLWLSGKRVSSPSVCAAALGEEGVFPECLDCSSRGRECFSRVLHSGKIFFKKEMTPAATNGVNSSPSARTALEEAFPERTIFGSRRRRLSREEVPRGSSPSVALGEGFPECNWAFPECF